MKINYTILIGIAIVVCSSASLKAQLYPLQAQYYTNRYLGNSAMAGIAQGLALNLSHRAQLTGVPGAPLSQNITAEYGFNKVGLGLNATVDKAGLQNYIRALASFAYHLPLSNETSLHFGLSAGVIRQRINTSDISGNPNDNLIDLYNQRNAQFDSDFGIALTTNRLSLEAFLPNLKNLLKKYNNNIANLPMSYAAVSYKIDINNAELEPKIAIRSIKGLNDIWDAGAQLSFAKKQLQLNGMYHSTGTASFGLGVDYKKKYLIGFSHTLQTTSISNYTNGDFEFNLRIKLQKDVKQ